MSSLCVAAAMWGVPAMPGVRTVQQPDGSTLSVILVGDERGNAYTTLDGRVIARNRDSGAFCYLDKSGLSTVMAHNPDLRTAQEQDFLRSSAINIESANARRRSRIAANAAKASTQRRVIIPSKGEVHVPVLLVAYSDYDFRDGVYATDTFEEFFNGTGQSARQYFVDQSNGAYSPQFDIYGPVTLTHPRVYYGGNNEYGNDLRPGTMVAEACIALDSQIDFSKYDYDGDGECDTVIVLYAGDAASSSYAPDAADAIWPHQWDLFSSDYYNVLNLDNVIVNNYAVFNELYGVDNTCIDGIGNFCHEFSHCLGLPDFYDIYYRDNFGMGPWSVMCHGSYNNNGYTPIGYSAYEKYFMGWVNLAYPEEDTRITLPVWNAKDAATDIAYRVDTPDPEEYFILENRQKQGWDKYMYASGMMITHVTYNRNDWINNLVNTRQPNGMTIVPADNSLPMVDYSGSYFYDRKDVKGDLWPYGDAIHFTDVSVPRVVLNYLENYRLDKPIEYITRNADGTISFSYKMQNPDAVEVVQTDADAAYFSLQGVALPSEPLTPGMYVHRTKDRVEKVLVK